MDTSKKYILMCEKAEEIQELAPRMATRIHTKNNIFICSDYDHELGGFFYCIDTFSDEEPAILESTRSVWLPRQDQLQEMMGNNWEDNLGGFWEYITDSDEWGENSWFSVPPYCGDAPKLFTSMEQLWLAFVMSEKYQKKWLTKERKWVKM